MGWRCAEWAYTVDKEWDEQHKLPLPQKSVLAAVCMRADDKTNQTFVGQETIVGMTGASKATVSRSLRALERHKLISRQPRYGVQGYRTSDLITIHLGVTVPSSQSAYQADSNDLGVTLQSPTSQSDVAEEITQIDHSVDHSDIPELDEFELWLASPIDPNEMQFKDFWEVWPKKAAKLDASKAWAKAIKKATPLEIVQAAKAYGTSPFLPPRQFIPNAATWLNGERWNDPPLEAPQMQNNKPTPTDRARAILALVPDATTHKEISG